MKYTGRLAKPVTRSPQHLLLADALLEQNEHGHRATTEALAKLPDLFAAHGQDDGDWIGLALSLAFAHVPGFKMVDPPGRRTKWTAWDKAELRYDVDRIRRGNPKLSVPAALAAASKLERWAKKTKGMNSGALKKHYYGATDPRAIALVAKSRAYDDAVRRGETIHRDY
jgi:hypothetical protein